VILLFGEHSGKDAGPSTSLRMTNLGGYSFSCSGVEIAEGV
jgi:hypothetical protein